MCYSGKCPDEDFNGDCQAIGVKHCEAYAWLICPDCRFGEEICILGLNAEQETECPKCGFKAPYYDFLVY